MIVGAFAAALALGAPQFPALTGRVVDDADLLSAGTEAQLTQLSVALETKTGSQLVVVTVPDLQGYAVEDFGYQLGREWGIGNKGENDGLLLLVAKADRKVRIEVGYGLEGVITDALSSVIIQRDVLPRFRANDYDAGVLAGAKALSDQVGADPERQKAQLEEAAHAERAPLIPQELVFFLLFVGFIVFLNIPRGRRGQRYRNSSWGGPVILWGGSGSDRGGWGGGGGGFSGGGGSFGGGGASGSW